MNRSLRTSRRGLLALGAGFCAAGLMPGALLAGVRPVIVELFTSQGCSSCPPADNFMRDLTGMSGVIAMSLNVDYWDYLGWRDTLASPANSQRQYAYAKARGDMDVYTPQIIIDGMTHFVGSNQLVVKAAIARSLASTRKLWIPMSLQKSGGEFIVTVADLPHGLHAQDATIWIVTVAPMISVRIERGENMGQEIAYRNVVRKLIPAGMWHGSGATLNLPVDDLMTDGCKGVVALLQTRSVGPVIGAASWGQLTS